MDKGLPTYFKACRKKHGISQKQMAVLLGHKTSFIVSRIENGHRKPCLNIVLSYIIIFDVKVDEIIPKMHEQVEHILATRICCNRHIFRNSYMKKEVFERFEKTLNKLDVN